MTSQSPEAAGGNKPQHYGLSGFEVLPEQRGVGPRVKNPEAPTQQPADPELEAFRQVQEMPRGSTVFVGPLRVPRPLPQNPTEQRGEAEPSQPNPAEQQAAEQLGKPPPEEPDNISNSPVQEQDEPHAGENELSEKADEVDIPYGMGMVWPQPPFPQPRSRRRKRRGV